MTDLEWLRFYMKPYYQATPGDDAVLQAFLDEFGAPVCAAAELWAAKFIELGVSADGGVTQLKNGAESTSYGDVTKSKEAAEKNAEYFADKCKALTSANTGGIFKVAQSSVGGVPADPVDY